jgi:arylsulfatase
LTLRFSQVKFNVLFDLLLVKTSMENMDRRSFLNLLGAGVAYVVLPGGCGKDKPVRFGPQAVRHIVMISLDTTRRDHLGCYGNNWIRTPRLDELASESILFTNCMTVVPTTLPSHTSLFTGKYPHTHGTPRNGFMVNRKNVMLAEVLKDAGFRTVCIAGSFVLVSRFDFSQGFDYYNEKFERFVADRGLFVNERPAQSVTDAAIKLLEKEGSGPNLFLFVHYFDPHWPYTPPSSYNEMYKDDRVAHQWFVQSQGKYGSFAGREKALNYAGEISYMDEHVGRLIDYLKKRRILDDAIVIVTSDHGENFCEHQQFWSHGFTVYETTMSAVCMVRLPNRNKSGMKVRQLIANIDLMPTLLNYLGISIPDGIDGEAIELTGREISFPPRIRFGQASRPWKKVETDRRWYNIRKARCVYDGKLKYIQTPYAQREELYDLSTDPYERNNLLLAASEDFAGKAGELKRKLEVWANSAAPLPSHFEPSQYKDTIRKLKSLGYLE